MPEGLLSSKEAARRLGITPGTFYGWLTQSNAGQFMLNGHVTEIIYYQSGPRGGGPIRIEAAEVDRLQELMRVAPSCVPARRAAAPVVALPGITVKLGRPASV